MRGFVVAGVIALAVSGLAQATVMDTDVPPLPDLLGEVREASRAAGEAVPASDTGRDAVGPPMVDPGVGAPADILPEGAVPVLVGAGLLGLAGLVAYGASLHLGSRFSTPAEVLANEVRERIFLYLRERVGANLKQITDDLSLTTTNAIWHLRKLEDAGLIHSRRFNGYKIFYPAEGGVEARKLSLSLTALANENARNVFEFVVANPGTHQREIARALSVNHGTVRWHLKKLRRAEVLAETRSGKTSIYFPTDTGVTALASFRQQRAAATPFVAVAQ